jgi:hypothetical protein
MHFELDFRILIDQETVDSTSIASGVEQYREAFGDPGKVEGSLVLRLDKDEVCCDQLDPLLRLMAQWVRKLPWILSGDTETVALRNSEHCYAFVPAGESVEISFFAGSESEIEDYVLDPVNVRVDQLVTQSLAVAERLLDLVRQANPAAPEADEDYRDLVTALDEGRVAWRKHQVHSRR